MSAIYAAHYQFNYLVIGKDIDKLNDLTHGKNCLPGNLHL